mmetsp:Transcript_19564/g.42068  ORF Transcript_19564/g.42068 Transcript_19564/m.42068 type:complete len:254 (+) Transcript_19564:45-806(+)
MLHFREDHATPGPKMSLPLSARRLADENHTPRVQKLCPSSGPRRAFGDIGNKRQQDASATPTAKRVAFSETRHRVGTPATNRRATPSAGEDHGYDALAGAPIDRACGSLDDEFGAGTCSGMLRAVWEEDGSEGAGALSLLDVGSPQGGVDLEDPTAASSQCGPPPIDPLAGPRHSPPEYTLDAEFGDGFTAQLQESFQLTEADWHRQAELESELLGFSLPRNAASPLSTPERVAALTASFSPEGAVDLFAGME